MFFLVKSGNGFVPFWIDGSDASCDWTCVLVASVGLVVACLFAWLITRITRR